MHVALLLGPLALTGRLGVIQGALALVWVGGSAVEHRFSVGEHDVPLFERVRAVALLVMVWIALFTADPLPVGLLIGCLLFVGGLGLRVWSIMTLGTGFSAGFEPTVAVTTAGPYRLVKHPSEWGLQLMGWGLAMGAGSLAAGVAAALLVSVPSLFRMRLEDAHLSR